MTQLAAFATLALYAQNLSITISFGNIGTPILFGVSVLHVVMITFGVFIILLLAFFYILPLKIAADPENPLKWYYPCVCGCLRSRDRQQAQIDDELNDNEQ